MTEPYTEEALWNKARVFISLAMDTDAPRTFEEQALWASLGLEMLAKAALAKVSPLLIADPTEGNNLLVASGLIEGKAAFQSVAAKTVFTRCARVFRPFSFDEAMLIAKGRNEYIHAGTPTISRLPAKAWWPRFWAQAVTLVLAQDKGIEDLVGSDRVPTVESYLATNKENIEHRATAIIERAKQLLGLHQSGGMSARMQAEWSVPRNGAGLSHSAEATCPACGNLGNLEGEDVTSVEQHAERLSEYDYEVTYELTVGSDHFSCPTCRLVLDGYELIAAAGLPEDFSAEGDPSDYYDEGDYGND